MHGSSAVKNYDNIGYDLSRFDRRRRVRDALANEPVARPRPIPSLEEQATARKEAKTRAKAAAAAKAQPVRISPFAVLSYLAVTVLLVWIVFSYMSLNELSVETANLKRELTALQEEAVTLSVQYDQRMDLRAVEVRAAQLGMVRPASDQVIYMDLSQPDYAIMRSESTDGASDFLGGLRGIAAAVVSFFS
ncbi:hypothetical protein LJC32_04540 [Oscillospiraceae bacterium OttesenSCG-928-F05]|nr:hypothetical protein [Oscillospiraceae bacterium OttesenSCG-928-F05]